MAVFDEGGSDAKLSLDGKKLIMYQAETWRAAGRGVESRGARGGLGETSAGPWSLLA
jgi:hypothetical protein